MINTNLLQLCEVVRVMTSQPNNTTTLSSDIVDTAGYDGCLFVAALGDVTDTTVLALTAQQNTANSGTGMATLAGGGATFTASATSADNKTLVLDVYQPRERYLRCQLARGTGAGAVVDGVIAILYRTKNVPATQGATAAASAVAFAPAEA